MPLQPENYEILFEGLSQKTTERTLKAGALVSAKNVEFDKQGQLNKRRGYLRYRFDGSTQIGALGNDMETQAFRVTTFKDELLVMAHWLWAVADKGAGIDSRAAVRRGRLMLCNIQTRHVISTDQSEDDF